MDGFINQLNAKMQQLGLELGGFVPAAPGRRLDAYLRWVAAKKHGRMGYLARPDRLERRQDLNVILSGVQTIISVGLNYHTFQLPESVANNPARGKSWPSGWMKRPAVPVKCMSILARFWSVITPNRLDWASPAKTRCSSIPSAARTFS